MVIATESRVHPDIASVIVGRDLVADKDSIKGWMSVEGDTVSFTRDESSTPESFELTAEEEDFLYGGDRSFVRLFHSDGGSAEQVAEFPAWEVTGYGADDGFPPHNARHRGRHGCSHRLMAANGAKHL